MRVLDGRLQDVLSIAYFLAQFAMRLPRRSGKGRDWRAAVCEPRAAAEFDIPAVFFSRIADAYSVVVEIGAADGRRSLALAIKHPNVIALDMAYRERRDAGASFRPYHLDEIPAGALVVCVGTLVCFSPADFSSFLLALRAKCCALAYFEPVPVFKIKHTIRRRISGGYYHAYRQVLPAHGFQTKVHDRWPYLGSPELERWEYDFWTPI